MPAAFSVGSLRPSRACKAISHLHHIPKTRLASSNCSTPRAVMDSYSLWLIPSAGALYDRLAAEIRYQASTHNGPVFKPHVTLLGGIEEEEAHVVALAHDLAQELEPYKLSLQHAATGSIYHQCVFLRCASTPAVMDAAWLARQRFGMPHSEYMPHLSLLYSECDETTRQNIAQDVNTRWFTPGSPDALPVECFEVRALSVWRTNAEDTSLESWEKVAEFEIGGEQ